MSLPAEEAGHLSRVLRLGPGTRVRVFDGRGGEFLAEVESKAGDAATLRLLERCRPVAEPAVAITLAVARLKGAKMDGVVRDAVMLGVHAIQPVESAHVEVGGIERLQRWRRIAVASAKQCGRAVVPDVRMSRTLDQVLAEDGGQNRRELRLGLVEPGRDGGERVGHLRGQPRPETALVLAGPEGGWTADELERLVAAGCRLLTLGPRTLRADAVPLAVLPVLQLLWDDL